MKIIKPQVIIERDFSSTDIRFLERVIRTCYKSEDKIGPGTADALVEMIQDRGHMAMLEHIGATVRFITDRGVSHELVRHRVASFAQESTRYCNYAKEKFGGELTFVEPPFFDVGQFARWRLSVANDELDYLALIDLGAKPEEARTVLPNSLKTEIVVTANAREWLHILDLRASPKAHPQMRQIMRPLARHWEIKVPALFAGIVDRYPPDESEAEVTVAQGDD